MKSKIKEDKDYEMNNEKYTLKEKYITKQKIDDLKLHDILKIQDGSNGSLFVFNGIVRRDKTEKEFVREIIYETYEEMAKKEMEKIKQEASRKFQVNEIFIKHRIGRVLVGEVSLVVAVFSTHRREGIGAIDYIVDEIKKKVPVWKKEIFEDGSYRWVEGDVRYK